MTSVCAEWCVKTEEGEKNLATFNHRRGTLSER